MKPKMLFRGPVTTASGYGVHSRQLLRAIIASNMYDVHLAATNWGQTPFIHDDTPFMRLMKEMMVKRETDPSAKYDISVQVTIPNEFEKLATVNIGVTAGIEVDRASPEWIKKINENVDVLFVPSKHSAETIAKVVYRTQDGQHELKLNKPIFVVPEGVETTVFNTEPPLKEDVLDFEIGPDFNFLFVGLGLDKGMGEDRKNVTTLIKWFCETFKGDQDVGLVLKLSLVNHSILDFEMVKRRIADIKRSTDCGKFPEIKLIHGKLSERQLAALYKHPKVKAMVSLTHGEGFGLPLIEAAACGLPIIATNWSGHIDFLSVEGKKRFVPIDFDLAEIPQASVWSGVMEAGSRWANPRENDTKQKLKKLVLSYEKPKEWAGELAKHIAEQYNVERVCFGFSNTLADFLNGFAEAHPRTPAEFATAIRKKFVIAPGEKTILYTMPMSAGDVFISTSIIDSLARKFPEHRIYFATNAQYVPILLDNPQIHKVIQYEPWMQDVPLCELVFSEVFTPNLAIQTVSANWIRGGKGRLLEEEMAVQCQVEPGHSTIRKDRVEGLPEKFIAFHPGSGKGQWEARNYLHWQEVVENVQRLSGLPIVQLGMNDDPLYEGVIDFRGKTTYNQLAYVVCNAKCLLSIDSVAMHMAASAGVKTIALFGSSYSSSTGPVQRRGALHVLLETPNRYTCEKACYKYQCSVDREHPCINEISPRTIVETVISLIGPIDQQMKSLDELGYKEHRPKISGYTTVLNGVEQGFPFAESIISMLGFCDEVVVVDGGSTDKTMNVLRNIAESNSSLQIYERKWDWNEPGMDGMQKAFARAMCSGQFLWQQDADEVVHEEDYEKIRKLVKRFPKDVDLLHLPVVELWNGGELFRTDRHSWKWRLSRDNFKITHGINKNARVIDEKTGRTYAKKGMSDGCEYVDIMSGEFIAHKGFYTSELESLRKSDPAAYGAQMNEIFRELPIVYHYSWANIPRKIRSFRDFWDRCWSNLYNEQVKEQRFFVGRNFSEVTDEEIIFESISVALRGGEHGSAVPVFLERSNPDIMKAWLDRAVQEYGRGGNDARGHLRDDEEQTGSAQEFSSVSS